MDQDSFTPEEGKELPLDEDQELLLAVLRHVIKMGKKGRKALDMIISAMRAAKTKLPKLRSDEECRDCDPVNRGAAREAEEYKLYIDAILADREVPPEEYKMRLAALLDEDYEPPAKLYSTARVLVTGFRFYADILKTLNTPDALRRPAFYVNKCLPKLLIIDERMSQTFFLAATLHTGMKPFVTNMERTKKTNLARRDGTDQDVLATIEKLKAGDPKDRERYTKTGLASAIFKTMPGTLPTQRTIENSLKRLFFDHRSTTGRGQKFSLRDLTE